MPNISRFYKLSVVAMLALATQGCKKENGIDNNRVITKPYTLYVADSLGVLYNTNNGTDYKIVFPTDGAETRALATAGNNIISIKKNAHVSEDNGLNFNPINLQCSQDPTQTHAMVLNVRDWNRIYMASNLTNGIIKSDSSGKRLSWKAETHFEPAINTANLQITSFARLAKGDVFAYDKFNKRILTKKGKDNLWQEQAIETTLPTANFFLSSFINTLILADASGANGVWYSVNNGKNWSQYQGIPASSGRIFCAIEAYGQTLLVGTEFGGVYRLPLASNTFVQANNGLDQYSIIRGLSAKDDHYKNDKIIQYIYAATSTGLYRSLDLGLNWILVKPGNYTAIY